MKWCPDLNGNTPAGEMLKAVAKALPEDRHWQITVFGSAPLQIGLDKSFLSADVDITGDADIEAHMRNASLLKGQRDGIFVHVCPHNTFRTCPDWHGRAAKIEVGHVTFTLPHPIDILVSKLTRLEDKDLDCFALLKKNHGFPDEATLLAALKKAVDIYRPQFDEENCGDPVANTKIVWKEIYGKDIDVRKEIIAPALLERKKCYGLTDATLKEHLYSIQSQAGEKSGCEKI